MRVLTSLLLIFYFPLVFSAVEDGAFVHLFEWTWNDIAIECKTHLAPAGWTAVQVSPPNEHAVLAGAPWYQRYQPVSYALESRSGSRDEFAEMVRACRSAGVDIYVDTVINHMAAALPTGRSGIGSAGSRYSRYLFPIFSYEDFHHCGRNGNDDISNWNDRWEVQNCELLNLSDLSTEKPSVQSRIASYLTDLVSLGVMGFRIDAAKHIPTEDIRSILSLTGVGRAGPYVFQEVIDFEGEPISAIEYLQNGAATEFRYAYDVSRAFRDGRIDRLVGARPIGEPWGYLPSARSVVFLENHDTQRTDETDGTLHQGDGTLYTLGNIFLLAWPYGRPKILSDYHYKNRSQGPPAYADGRTRPVYGVDGLGCKTGWNCQHRDPALRAMAQFRKIAASGGRSATHRWTNGSTQIAFGRNGHGFVVINRDPNQPLNQSLRSGLLPGLYCDVLSGGVNSNQTKCQGRSLRVEENGLSNVSVPAMTALAVHSQSRVSR